METLLPELLVSILAEVTKQCEANIPAMILVSKYWKVHCPTPCFSLQLYTEIATRQDPSFLDVSVL